MFNKIKNNIKFVNAKFNKLNVNCNILQSDFFSDSFHYFPITKNNETFSSLYLRTFSNIEHFYKQKFFENFSNNKNNLKSFDDVFVLGSNAGNNYYSNLLEFLPRIFFNNKKNIKIAINRNSSNKYRKFLEGIFFPDSWLITIPKPQISASFTTKGSASPSLNKINTYFFH